MTRTAILVPVLNRPHRIIPTMESVAAVTDDYRLLFIGSAGDEAELAALRAANADFITEGSFADPCQYARKINAGYRATTEPLLFLAADDLHFHPQWLERAISRLGDGVQVVGTNDLGNPRVLRGVHSTHTLVTRAYVDEFGTIDEPGKVLHEGYPHEFSDDEFVETAWKREVWAFAHDSIVEHLHPAWGKAPMDELYAQEPKRLMRGKRLFLNRRHLWTPNPGP